VEWGRHREARRPHAGRTRVGHGVTVMTCCIICRFEMELDDVALTCARGRCVCLRCFARETGSVRTMPAALRREIAAILATSQPP
jgi:hypothetical protein